MIHAQADFVLKHLRGLVAAQNLSRLPDRELLERFTRGEQEAFEALVRRHGPMVLGVCRRVLHHQHDAEDAFQATFWTLARGAGSAGKRGSLGGWLHRVAFRISLKARTRATSRQKYEQQSVRPPAADPLTEVTGRELVTVVDEELHRLPERLQAPLVLCYLQGKTRDEAARQLGWPLGTLKHRLDQGKESLRVRLARRGLALSAVLAAGMSRGAEAAVPPLLLASTSKSATGGAPGAAAALAEPVLRTARATWLTLASAGLLLAGMVALGIVIFGHRALAGQQIAAPNGENKSNLSDRPRPASAAPVQNREMTISGRVVAPDGKGVAGARVALLAQPIVPPRAEGFAGYSTRRLAQGQADGAGRFRLRAARTSSAHFRSVYVLAAGGGHGLGWLPLDPDAGQAQAVIPLPPEQVIRGRLVDLQGQPAPGVQVSVEAVGQTVGGVYQEVSETLVGQRLALWPAPATTDARGGFRIHGLSSSQRITLTVRDPRFAPRQLVLGKDRRDTGPVALAPAQVIEGTVLDADTRKPIPQVHVTAYPRQGKSGSYGAGVAVRTDDKGRFRLNPFPGTWFSLLVHASPDRPYLTVRRQVQWPRGAVRHKLALTLPRGVLVSGKVTDKTSGKPVAGASVRLVSAPLVTRGGNEVIGGWESNVFSGADGVFRIPVRHGTGHLLVSGPGQDYLRQEIGSNVLDSGKPGGERYYPDAVVKLDIPARARTWKAAVTLRRGIAVTGRLVGPDGKPVDRAVMLCRLQVPVSTPTWCRPAEVRGGHFELRGCDPAQAYPVLFLEPKRKLGAALMLSPRKAGGKPVTVRLMPCGRAVVRFVSQAGKPVVKHYPILEIVVTPGPHRYEAGAYDSGKLLADGGYVASIDPVNYRNNPVTDAQGRCTFPALIPGATYRLVDLSGDTVVQREFTVEAGKTRDLGEVRLKQ